MGLTYSELSQNAVFPPPPSINNRIISFVYIFILIMHIRHNIELPLSFTPTLSLLTHTPTNPLILHSYTFHSCFFTTSCRCRSYLGAPPRPNYLSRKNLCVRWNGCFRNMWWDVVQVLSLSSTVLVIIIVIVIVIVCHCHRHCYIHLYYNHHHLHTITLNGSLPVIVLLFLLLWLLLLWLLLHRLRAATSGLPLTTSTLRRASIINNITV